MNDAQAVKHEAASKTQNGAGPIVMEPLSIPLLATWATCGLYMLLPPAMILGPRWLLLIIVTAVLIPLIIFRLRRQFLQSHVCGHLILLC